MNNVFTVRRVAKRFQLRIMGNSFASSLSSKGKCDCCVDVDITASWPSPRGLQSASLVPLSKSSRLTFMLKKKINIHLHSTWVNIGMVHTFTKKELCLRKIHSHITLAIHTWFQAQHVILAYLVQHTVHNTIYFQIHSACLVMFLPILFYKSNKAKDRNKTRNVLTITD